jgi:phage gp36-like protein
MYCTQDDIIKGGIPEDDLIQLTDNDNTDMVDSTVVAKVIARQDELINGYLRSRYTLPLNPVPGLLNGLAIALCCQALYRLRPHLETPEAIVDAAADARKQLGLIQSGLITLDVAEIAETTTESVQVKTPDRLFGTDTLDRY